MFEWTSACNLLEDYQSAFAMFNKELQLFPGVTDSVANDNLSNERTAKLIFACNFYNFFFGLSLSLIWIFLWNEFWQYFKAEYV